MENMPDGIYSDFPSWIICAIIPYEFRVQAIGYEMSLFKCGNTIFFTNKLKARPEVLELNSVYGMLPRIVRKD